MEGPSDQLAALIDLATVLDQEGIPFAIIGGIAVGIHSAAPRATNDVDCAVPTSVVSEAIEALTAAGFLVTGRFEHSINLRHRGGEPVQIAFDPAFDPMIGRAERIEVAGTPILLVRRDDLISMKERAAADPARRRSKALRDQADIELLRGDVPGPDEGW